MGAERMHKDNSQVRIEDFMFPLSGPALGKPPKNPVLSRQAKKQGYQDSCGRNAVER